MKQLVSETLSESLRLQIGHELYNHTLYTTIGCSLKNRGLDGLAGLFESGAEEELKHKKFIQDLLTDLNVPVYIPEIPATSDEYNTITSIAQAFFDREVLTTDNLIEIKNLATEEGCGIVEEAIREMISWQQNEIKEAYDFSDQATLCGDDWWKVKVWSDSLK